MPTQQTIRNLARFGVKVICYNFMPVFRLDEGGYELRHRRMAREAMAFEKKISISGWKTW
ncbi:mannonate dehydratase [Klebsiella pneumoniae]|nr:mannonate dehydratase [Klebsiella pneumoniae]